MFSRGEGLSLPPVSGQPLLGGSSSLYPPLKCSSSTAPLGTANRKDETSSNAAPTPRRKRMHPQRAGLLSCAMGVNEPYLVSSEQ